MRPDRPTYTYRIGAAAASDTDKNRAFLRAFGLNLKLARTAKGITQEELGALIGLHRTFVGQLERGQRGCNLVVLRQICEALDLRPADLIPVLHSTH